MNFDFTVNPEVFKTLLNVDVKTLATFSSKQLRAILPCLVRMSLIAPVDSIIKCSNNRREILTLLSNIEVVNSIVALLSIDFHALEIDVKQEQSLRKKLGNAHGDSVLTQNFENGLALEFERSDSTRRLRLVLCEILYIASQIQDCQKNTTEFYIKNSDLFDNAVYIPEVCDVLNIALAELPALFSLPEIVQTLLHVKHGKEIICWIVANFPDYFYDVAVSIIQNSDKSEDDTGGTRIRIDTLTELCKMYPQAAYVIRAKCVELCKMPALTITLTLDFPDNFHGDVGSSYTKTGGDIVAFVSGLLLGNDQAIRNWFSLFTRFRPKIKESNVALQRLRDELILQLKLILKLMQDPNKIPYSCVVHGSVLLRLYCALRAIAGIKFHDEEILLLVRLMTIYPPASPEGVRFVSIAVCMMFACPSLISQIEYEAKFIHWLKWLSGGDSPFFGKPTDITASFSEMLLLLAIHVHSGQITAISDLVCSTLGMRVSIRNHNMTRVKVIFMQEVFTEQVVTSRAISVLVTPNLNANIHGFLPIHCIHQLMKSRAFSKHKVNVKDWIYKQICTCVAPLHPLLPSLIDVYVNSMLNVSTTKLLYESTTNERISEEEIMEVFKDSLSHANITETRNRSFMPQLLLLYYILLYEDVRLSNMQNYINTGRQVKSYSAEFLSEFPIKYLLQQAHKDQLCNTSLFSSLLRLLATHFPHLSLVEDWLEDEDLSLTVTSPKIITEDSLADALRTMSTCSSQTSGFLNALLKMPLKQMWPYVNTFIKYLPSTLDDSVPLYVRELYKKVWLRFNSVLPRSLWVMTIKALLHENAMLPSVPPKQEKIIIDPLQILRCDNRVFRCAPVLSIVIRVLQSSLAASRSQLSRHLLDGPLTNTPSNNAMGLTNDTEREELKNALIAAQESAASQILLETCLETKNDNQSKAKLWSLREVQSLVCSYMHQAYIADPSLCKLVHFQGYPRELLPVTVVGIPSMHICVDFIAELISQPSLEKQEFAVDLISHLALQYALPHSMMVARLAFNTLSSLLAVSPSTCRIELFTNTLPAFVRICEAFPPLIEDTIALLVQLGKICLSEASLKVNSSILGAANPSDDGYLSDSSNNSGIVLSNDYLCKEIEETFMAIISRGVLKNKIY